MRRFPFAAVAVMAMATVGLGAGDPITSLNDAKNHLAAKRYEDALNSARTGIEAATAIPAATERAQALGALNFYAAAAATGAGETRAATIYLEEFARFAPTMRRIDPAKHDPRFVSLFNAVLLSGAEEDMFSALYPDYAAATVPPHGDDRALIEAAAVEILGTRAERKEWTNSNFVERREFLDRFWSRRDLTAASPANEWRDQVYRRIVFADRAFGPSPAHRGSLTDRGRVFVLLGRPAFVRRRPIDRTDRVQIVGTEAHRTVNGTMEHWVYSREQLPVTYTKPSVMYRFVTQEGIGDNVMQKDNAFAMNALAVAAAPLADR